jgi:hypothetical protein
VIAPARVGCHHPSVIVPEGVVMGRNISYPGVGGAVSGAIGIFGIYAGWWETPTTLYYGTADISGSLGLAMSIGLIVFGGGAILFADPRIRRTMSALFTICAVLLTLTCVWALVRTDEVAAGASLSKGLWVSLLGGICGIAAGLLAMRPTSEAAPASVPERDPSDTSSA